MLSGSLECWGISDSFRLNGSFWEWGGGELLGIF